MEIDEVPEGFTITELPGPGAWAEMTHSCGKRVQFANPRPERVEWYVGSHRCGGDPNAWQRGGAS